MRRRAMSVSSLRNTRAAKLLPGEVSEWLMVPLSKSGVRKHRGFESRPLRQTLSHGSGHPRVGPSAPSLTHLRVRALGCSVPPWAGLAHGIANIEPLGEDA